MNTANRPRFISKQEAQFQLLDKINLMKKVSYKIYQKIIILINMQSLHPKLSLKLMSISKKDPHK